ncbi:efflux transporter outer membrane subunit [Alcaligenaceae bacterium C4P045]|nr:efflux transporter outer membrane subunit [Alcaligenaceae bacterium C4P045]
MRPTIPAARLRAISTSLIAIALLAGCGVARDRTTAGLTLPAAYSAETAARMAAPTVPQMSPRKVAPQTATHTAANSTQQAAAPLPQNATDWQRFGNAELADLIAMAHTGAFDLAAAMARVRQAEAYARMAGAALLPQVDASASAGRSRTDGDTASNYGAGLSASYEIDVWGGNAAARDAARASLAATRYGRDTVQLTLTAGVATTWMQTVGARERTAIARLNLDAAERVLALVDTRWRAGMATPLERAQQRGLVATQRQAFAARERDVRDAQATLALLLGRPPQDVAVRTAHLHSIASITIAPGVPADLLTRRPDVALAERELAAADANVAAARAALLPRLTLTAGVGVGHNQVRGLFDNPLYNLAAGLTAPVFDAGRLSGARDLALAQREELLADYRAAIVNAIGDVSLALNAIDSLAQQRQAQEEALAQAREAARLSESRYRFGAETLLTVLDAQRTLYAAQDDAVVLHLAQLQAEVALFKAAGGDWR